MKTELALREFIASRIAANLSLATIEWYKDRLLPFVRSCPTLPRRPEPIEGFLATINGSPETDLPQSFGPPFKLVYSASRLPAFVALLVM